MTNISWMIWQFKVGKMNFKTNKIYDDFIWRFKGCVNRHSPQKKVNKKEQKLINKAWITPAILKKIKHRNDIFVKKKTKPEDEKLSEQRYKKLQKELLLYLL